jgi:hypothetical protein
MNKEKRAAAQGAGDAGERLDRRERFILRGDAADLPSPVPDEPEPAVDVEAVLSRLEWPRRRRTRRPTSL